MQLYKLTESEIETINELNAQRVNVLLIVCDFGEHVGVDPDALQQPEYSAYLEALGGVFQANRVVEFDAPDPF